MKQLIAAVTITAITGAGIYYYPSISGLPKRLPITKPPVVKPLTPLVESTQQLQHNQIEVAFVLDTTGSMSGLIQAAKDNIWSIASSMASAESAPIVKMGLVAYRDRGDEYVTKVSDLSDDLDTNYGELMQYRAAGGGDAPESVNKALYDAVTKMSWSQAENSYKVIFLVGDAPPKMNYKDELQYPEIVELAKSKGIIINTIQCGQQSGTKASWKDIATLSQGSYFQVEQSGGAVAVITPFDKKIAALTKELDDTRIFYGSAKVLREKEGKKAAADRFNRAASPASVARKAEFNLSKSGKRNFSGDNELVADLESGKVQLDDIPAAELPKEVRKLEPILRHKLIKDKSQKRKKLVQKLTKLTEQRSVFIKEEMSKRDDAERSLDNQIYQTVKSQAAAKGLSYKDESAKY